MSGASVQLHDKPRILIVDDDTMILRSFVRTLASCFEVVTAQGGEAALAAIERDPSYVLVLFDMQMHPYMGGVELFDTVAARAPDLLSRLVLMSGNIDTPDVLGLVERGCRAVPKALFAAADVMALLKPRLLQDP
jgi:DNA-binding NtrC family response regulator